MTPLDRARSALSAHEALLSMQREAGETLAARATQARVNGLRLKVAKLTAEARRHAEVMAWHAAGKAGR